MTDPNAPHTRVDLKDRELATILAALRYWQREGLVSGGHEAGIAAEHGPPLTAEEIDDLCEALNCNGVGARANDLDMQHRIAKLVGKALEEVSIGNPETAEAHLRKLQSLVTPHTEQGPQALSVVDAVEIVLKLARAQLDSSNTKDSTGLAREACKVVEDFAVNHLGEE